MQAEVKSIKANNIHQWLSISIGPIDSATADLFQVAVATYYGLQARRVKQKFVGLMVDRFESSLIEEIIRSFVASCQAATWEEIVTRLRVVMVWEFADYRP